MKYIKTYEKFKPITVNSDKPFKVKKNIDRSILHIQRGIKSLRKRLDDPKQKDVNKHAKMNNDKNAKIHKLNDLTFKKLKQQEYLRNNPIKENVDNEENLIDVLSSPDFKGEDIVNYIGLDEKEYEIEIERKYNSNTHEYESEYNDDGLKILMKTSKLENLMSIEHGVIDYFMQFGGYNNYEYYVDDDELNYLYRYLSDEIMEKIKKLSKLFKTDIDLETSEYSENKGIPELFIYLGLKDKLDDFKYEISSENENALEESSIAEIKKLPFELNHTYDSDKFSMSLYFVYDELIEYMKKHDLSVKNIKELLENIDNADEFTIENEYERISEFIGDFDDLKKCVETVVDDYLEFPDDIYPKLIAVDNLEAFKNNLEFANFDSVYQVWINYDRKRINLFEIAKSYNNNITQWLSSEEFEKFIMTQSEAEINNYQDFIIEDLKKYNI